MAKDLTNSRIDRQNILNNELAVAEIQEKSGIKGIFWNDKIYVTKEMTADFFEVDIRTISRYIEQNTDELTFNGYEVLKGKKLKEFISQLKTVKKIEILPYHDLGKFKWSELGCKYELEGVPTATSEDVQRAKQILRN